MKKLVSLNVLAGLIAGGIAAPAFADTLEGRVTDASGTVAIQGARVEIEETGRTTTTDRFGEYRITNLEPGTYTVIIDYVGADTVTGTVDIAASGATADFTLGGDVRFLDNVLVVGSRAAQAGAINQQRAADSIISVVDSDGLGNFPDTTVADTLQRVPGLSIVTDQGEGRYVSIRGINTDLIASSINGVRTPSPEDRRGVLLDGVPSDLLDGITVQKSLTPDVDGDSLGGIIDLKTVSAFDRDGRFIRAKVEGQWNEITEEISPKATLTYSEVFNDNFGVALSLNYQDLRIESHNNEIGEFGFENNVAYLNDDYEHRWYDLTRERLGFVANFDWRVNENTDLYLRTFINQYKDDEVRNKFEFRDLDDSENTGDGGIIAPGATTVPLNEVDAEVRVREETRNIQTVSFGGETLWNDYTFEYEVSYAFADEQDDANHDVTFRFKDIQDNFPGVVTFDLSNAETPVITGNQALLDAVYDPSNYDLDAFEREFSTNEDTEWAAKFDVSKDSLFMDVPVEWKVGFKYRDREKVRDENFLFFEPDLNLANFSQNTFITNWRLPNPQPTWPDPGLTTGLRSQFNDPTDPDFDEEGSFFDSNIADYVIDEQITALYGMGTFEFDKLTLVAGVRVEDTQTNLLGKQVVEDELVATEASFTSDYTNVLPSVNAKYEFSDKLIGRAAYYAAVVRPAFGDMAPIAEINDDRDEAALGNPALDPLTANNFDLSLEFYPTELSVLSVGLFYKDIKDGIFPAEFDVANLPGGIEIGAIPEEFRNGIAEGDPLPGGGTDTGEVEEIATFINVDSSEIFGVEFNYVQDLVDLNEMLDGFLVSANLTLSDSEATLPNGRAVRFLNQADTVGNFAIGYDKGPWDVRISANYRGNNLDEIFDTDPGDPVLDRTIDDRLLVEASAKYRVNDNLQLYLEGKNLTDEPEYYYFGDSSRLMQYDEFGTSFIFGARLTY